MLRNSDLITSDSYFDLDPANLVAKILVFLPKLMP